MRKKGADFRQQQRYLLPFGITGVEFSLFLTLAITVISVYMRFFREEHSVKRD